MGVQLAGKRLATLPRVRSRAGTPSIDMRDESELAAASLVRIGASVAIAGDTRVTVAGDAVSVGRRPVPASEDAE